MTLIPTEKILAARFEEIVGQEQAKRDVRSALLSGRHIILAGPPGIGKTTLAKAVAGLLEPVSVDTDVFGRKTQARTLSAEERFVRVQGSPDLTAEDLLGDIDPLKALQFGPASPEAFTPGKLFKAREGILFFDEVNRASEKLQNALLQALQEGFVTLGSYDVACPARFVFIGTMNPDDASTEQLSDVFLDRFDIVTMHYPASLDEELAIVERYGSKLCAVPEDLRQLMVRFVQSLREHKQVERKPSVRATLGLYERSQANALLAGRKEVSLADIEAAVPSVLSHRITLKPSIKFLTSPESFLEEAWRSFSETARRGGAG